MFPRTRFFFLQNIVVMNIISVHRIFPNGMTVYQCSEKHCSFVTGSRICFNRHVHRQTQVKFIRECDLKSMNINC